MYTIEFDVKIVDSLGGKSSFYLVRYDPPISANGYKNIGISGTNMYRMVENTVLLLDNTWPEKVKIVLEQFPYHHIIFVSGRDDICEKDTREWLNQNLKSPFLLYMRKTGDKRQDSIMKREIFSGLFLGSVLGCIGFLRVTLWSIFTPIYGVHWLLIAFTVGFSLIGVVMWGTISGSMLPIILKRSGADPAVSSAPHRQYPPLSVHR